jgi:hypothetical protein
MRVAVAVVVVAAVVVVVAAVVVVVAVQQEEVESHLPIALFPKKNSDQQRSCSRLVFVLSTKPVVQLYIPFKKNLWGPGGGRIGRGFLLSHMFVVPAG